MNDRQRIQQPPLVARNHSIPTVVIFLYMTTPPALTFCLLKTIIILLNLHAAYSPQSTQSRLYFETHKNAHFLKTKSASSLKLQHIFHIVCLSIQFQTCALSLHRRFISFFLPCVWSILFAVFISRIIEKREREKLFFPLFVKIYWCFVISRELSGNTKRTH